MPKEPVPAPSVEPAPARILAWKHPAWPDWRLDHAAVTTALGHARHAQGVAEGKLTAIGVLQAQELAAEAWSQEAVATAAIEGERLDIHAVRSSVARRLGIRFPGADADAPVPQRHVDGLLDIMNDAVVNAHAPLTHDRLQSWQAALFPTGYSGMTKIDVGRYRGHAEPMLIVSGRPGRETVHYEAPPSADVEREMTRFIDWFAVSPHDPLVTAALAHLWFETIHPFEDGNGRVGRVIVDQVLARDAGPGTRLLRISQQLLASRGAYYEELGRAQRGDLDATSWVVWFLGQVGIASEKACLVIDESLVKARFWARHAGLKLNERQRKVVNRLIDAGHGGFEGGMTTVKYGKMTGAARATASRELVALARVGILRVIGTGRATRYDIDLDANPDGVPASFADAFEPDEPAG